MSFGSKRKIKFKIKYDRLSVSFLKLPYHNFRSIVAAKIYTEKKRQQEFTSRCLIYASAQLQHKIYLKRAVRQLSNFPLKQWTKKRNYKSSRIT